MGMLIKALLAALAAAAVSTASASQCVARDGGRDLSCRLRTLQAGLQQADVEVGEAERLRLRCSDLFFAESALRTEHFGFLPTLERLRIEDCKLRRLPARAFAGLTNLRRLAVNSRNADWTSTVVLEADEDALEGLDRLEELDLASNNLWSLPAGFLCQMPKLRDVNVSGNHLLEVSDVGLASASDGGCRVNVANLDLSSNQLSTMREGDLSRIASSLESLDLSANRLTILGERMLGGLSALKKLDLGHNRLAALPVNLFNESRQLRELGLQNNSLALLPAGAFSGLDGLIVLNLSQNAISSHLLSKETFAGLTSLQVLDLSHNQLAKVEPELFSLLPSLKLLRLQHNAIHTLAPRSFSYLTSLEVVGLSHNKLSELTADALTGLRALTSLSLDHNEIAALPAEFFAETPLIEDLSLENNKLEAVPASVSKHALNLRTLDLGENKIGDLHDGDFASLSKLYGLRVSGNRLTEIRASQFANASGLHVLNLARNQLASIEQGSFSGLAELRALRLDNNVLADINGLVSPLEKLKWLNVSSNRLQWFDYAFIPSSLEWLDLHDNQIEELGNYYKLSDDFSLRTLDASANKIKALGPLSLVSSLETVLLAGNRISEVAKGRFEDKELLKTVDLSDNAIVSLEEDALLYSSKISHEDRPSFLLAGNPLECSCQTEWLRNVNDALTPKHARVDDLERLECSPKQVADVQQLINVAPEQFLCQYKTHCFALCMCCDFYACDCRMQCPEGCDCFHDSTWSTNVIQCSSRNHTQVPLLIPMDATSVMMDGNDMGDVDTQSFIGRRRVGALYLNASRITSLSSQSFSGLSGLEVLHLEDNLLKEIKGHEFASLGGALRELYLQNNDLVTIAENAFDTLASLAVLRLDGNLLTTFPVWTTVASLPMLVGLSLAENMWSCECDFMADFGGFLLAHESRIADMSAIKCLGSDLIAEDINFSANVSCSNENALVTVNGEATTSELPDLVIILVSCAVAVVVLLAVFCTVCVFRARIKAWLYHKSSEIYESRSGSSSIASGNTATYAQNRLFDVYITYSAKDVDFVDQTLAPTLERGATSYKLCLHQRDFPPNASLYDTVTVATESSARVLVVLSRGYVETEWPHVKIPLRNSIGKADTNKLIFLLLDDVSSPDGDEEVLNSCPELRQYLKQCAFVRWGSPGFLNKLRFFLPEPAFLTFQRNVTLRTLQPPLPLLKSGTSPGSLMQVDQVSGVWTYTLQNSPIGSVSTQSTDDRLRQQQHNLVTAMPVNVVSATPMMRANNAPSVISSVYSHHTYQSIPEHMQHQIREQQNQHIYHTLEPSLLPGQQQQQQQQYPAKPPRLANEQEQVNAVYINRNLDLVMKSEDGDGQKSSPSISPASSDSSNRSELEAACHHAHTQSGISAQQLIPPSSSSSSSSSQAKVVVQQQEDEYVV